MNKFTDKEIVDLLKSLINSGDLKLKVNITDNKYEDIANSTLIYKNRKIKSVKYSRLKDKDI
jgi:hypothetical protein